MRSARNRELIALVPVALLLTAGLTAVFIQVGGHRLGNLSLATHIYIRMRLPYADPYLFPLMALLAVFGLVIIYRIDATLARDQANWFVLGLVLFGAEAILYLVFFVVHMAFIFSHFLAFLGCFLSIIQLVLWLGILLLHIICIIKGLKGERFLVPGVSQYADKF